MKIFEYILGVVLFLLIGLKLLQVTGSGLFLVIGLLSMSMIYSVFGFLILNGIGITSMFKKSAYEKVGAYRIIGSVLLGWVISSLLIGVVFKLQLWEGGGIMLKMGLGWIILAVVVMAILYTKEKKPYLLKHLARLLLIGGIGLALYLIPSSKLVEIYYKDYPEYAKAFKATLANPDDQELKQIWIREMKKMDEEKRAE